MGTVATTQRPRSGGTKRAPAKQHGKRKGAPPPSAFDRLLRGVAVALDGHGADVVGLLCVGIGLVAGLGVYADAAGPVGRALDDGIGTLVGWGRLLAPLALIASGVLLVRGVADEDDPGAHSHIWVGGLLVAVAGCGLLHLAGGRPGLDAPTQDLAHAGGLLGVATAGPLAAGIAPWGAGLLLGTLALAGLVVLTRVPVRVAAESTAAGMRPAGTAISTYLRQTVGTLFSLNGEGPGGGRDVHVFDQDVDDLVEPEGEEPAAPKKPRARKAKVDVPQLDPDVEPTQLDLELGPAAHGSPWKLPPMSMLNRSGTQEVDKAAVEAAGRVLEHALAQHGVETRLVGMVVGPSVTRYELELGPGVKVARVTSLHKDIAYAMASPDVRILAPIPGRQAIGVEVPNTDRQIVALGDILASVEAKRATHPLEVAVGRDINGKAVLMNLATMPHILIEGATGAGK